MTRQANRFRYLPLLIAGLLAVPMGDSSGVLAFDSVPAATADVIERSVQTVVQPPTGEIGATGVTGTKGRRGKGRCANCGVIVSVVEMERNKADIGTIETAGVTTGRQTETSMKLTQRFKITIRMADGSIRAIDEASPANWRLGEQVILIAGANPAK